MALPSNHENRSYKLREQPFFLQLLTVDAVRRPRHGLQALLTDLVSTIGAFTECVVLDAGEGLFDQHQQIPLTVRKREIELFRICARRFVGEVLDPVVGECIARGLVPLIRVEQLMLLLAQSVDVNLLWVRLGFGSCHV